MAEISDELALEGTPARRDSTALTDALRDIKRTGQGILGLPGALAGGLINPIRKPFQESGLGGAIARGYAMGQYGPAGYSQVSNAQEDRDRGAFAQQQYNENIAREEEERNRQILAAEAKKVQQKQLSGDIQGWFGPKGGPDISSVDDIQALMAILDKHGMGDKALEVWIKFMENDRNKANADPKAQTEWHSVQDKEGNVIQQLFQKVRGGDSWTPSLRGDGSFILKIPPIARTMALPGGLLEQLENDRVARVNESQGPDMAIAVGQNSAYQDPLFDDVYVFGTGPDRRKQVEKLDYAQSLQQLRNAAVLVGEQYGTTAAWTDVVENLHKLFTGTGNPAAQNYIARRAMAMARKVKSLSGAQYSEKELRFYYDVFPTLKELIRPEDNQPYGLSAATTYKLRSESNSVFAAYTTPFQPETLPTREEWNVKLTKRNPISNMRVETSKALPIPSPKDFLQAAWATKNSFLADGLRYDGAGGEDDDISTAVFNDVMQTVLINQGFNPQGVIDMVSNSPEETVQIFRAAIKQMNKDRAKDSVDLGIVLEPIGYEDLGIIGIY